MVAMTLCNSILLWQAAIRVGAKLFVHIWFPVLVRKRVLTNGNAITHYTWNNKNLWRTDSFLQRNWNITIYLYIIKELDWKTTFIMFQYLKCTTGTHKRINLILPINRIGFFVWGVHISSQGSLVNTTSIIA